MIVVIFTSKRVRLNHSAGQIEQMVAEAEAFLVQSDAELDSLLHQMQQENDGLTLPEEAHFLQLLFQYRLDHQDLLVMLMQFEQTLMQTLQLDPIASTAVNLDRLIHLIGQEDLHQFFHDVNRIIHLLSKISQLQSQETFENHKKALKRAQKSKRLITSMTKACKKQTAFRTRLISFTEQAIFMIKHEPMGPVFNHLSALVGPISRFYQCIQSGLIKTNDLVKTVMPAKQGVLSLQKMATELENTLEKHLPEHHNNTLFQPKHRHVSLATLNQRAEKRRLTKFFHH